MPLIDCGDVNLYMERRGQPAGIPVVFVNGLLTDLNSWAEIEPAFAAHYPTVLYDCRGQGRSGKPDHPYTSQLHALDLVALVDRLGLESLHLVGLSSGAMTALLAAARLGPRVRSTVVSGVSPRVDLHLRLKLNSWLQAMEIGGLDLRFRVGIPWVWGSRFLENHQDDLERWRLAALTQDVRAAANLIRGAIQSGDIRATIREVQAPVLVLVGAEDILTPPHHAREVAMLVPRGQLATLPDGGHAAALEMPATFAELALRFFAEAR